MYGVELYAAVRLAVVDEGLSHHEAGRRFGIDRRTVKKMLSYSAPPGYRRTKPVKRPKLDGFTGIVDAILEADTDPEVPRKQRHTAHRIFERLRDEHGFTGGYTIVKDYVRARRQSTREAFVPLHHPPGHAQVDFGEAVVEVGGRREQVAFFCLILPHSNVWFVKAYPRETTEAVLEGDEPRENPQIRVGAARESAGSGLGEVGLDRVRGAHLQPALVDLWDEDVGAADADGTHGEVRVVGDHLCRGRRNRICERSLRQGADADRLGGRRAPEQRRCGAGHQSMFMGPPRSLVCREAAAGGLMCPIGGVYKVERPVEGRWTAR